MRKTQLDASTPRIVRGVQTLQPNEQPKVNYHLPLVATLLGAILVVLFVGVMTLSTLTITSRLLGGGDSGSVVTGGFCGLVTLACAAATIFFAVSIIKIVRDLFTPMQIERGVIIARQTGRSAAGANWITVRFEDGTSAEPVAATTRRMEPQTDLPLSTTSGATARQVAANSGLSFAAQLNQSAASSTTTANAGKDEPGEDLDALGEKPKGRSLRVDKHIFDALAVGDQVIVAFSRHIEHVYYVERLTEGANNLLLRNFSWI